MYCKLHNYQYIFSNAAYALPPYWIKVKMVQEILNTQKYKGVLWLDMDATIHDLKRTLDSFLKFGKYFYGAGDNPRWNSTFNAGIWFVLSNHRGRQIMNSWMNLYNSDQWKKETDGSWNTMGDWAGDIYEQGSFAQNILPRFSSDIELLPWQVLQDDSPNASSFTLHFAGLGKDERITNYFKS